MSSDNKIAALSQIALFRGCSKKQLEAIASVTEQVSVPAGHSVLTEGHVGHDMFILTSGTAEVTVADEVVATVSAGEVVGELGLVDGQRSSATVVAGEGVEGWLVARRGFAPLLDADPALARPILDAVISKLRAMDARLH